MHDKHFLSSIIKIKVLNSVKLNGGINSSVYKLTTKNDIFILKFFPEKKNDSRLRIKNEIEFLLRLEKANIQKVPKVINYDFKENWIMLNFLDGEKLKFLNSKNIKEIASFIVEIQKIIYENKIIMDLGFASESCASIMDHYNLVKKKILILIKLISKFSNDFNDYTKIYFKKELKSIEDIISKNLDKTDNHIYIISPSDIGIHNMLKVNNKINFLDFEYAGKDDIYKLISDLVVQPNYIFNEQLKDEFITEIVSALKIDIDITRLKILLAIYRLKWCFIIYKKAYNLAANSPISLDSVEKYLKKSNFWGINEFI